MRVFCSSAYVVPSMAAIHSNFLFMWMCAAMQKSAAAGVRLSMLNPLSVATQTTTLDDFQTIQQIKPLIRGANLPYTVQSTIGQRAARLLSSAQQFRSLYCWRGEVENFLMFVVFAFQIICMVLLKIYEWFIGMLLGFRGRNVLLLTTWSSQ